MINALFCLWVQSGCSKGTVAGALTFFPPEPALYQFERHTTSGRVLETDQDPIEAENDEKEQLRRRRAGDNNDDGHDSSTDSIGEIRGPGRTGSLEIEETRAKTNKKIKGPAAQLTDQANERRKRSKLRSVLDAKDVVAGVTYRLLLDPRLHVPPHDEHSIQAVKIPSPKGVHVAAVIYRVPNERRSATTKTIIISHGNATDIGAMFPIQVVIAHSLDCDVVVYDYSGYGESGGIPTECATYRDIEAVYEYTLENVTANQNPKNVILYGQSVGSGPCCYLIAQKDTEPLGGLILHSPFTSGMRVLTPSRYVVTILWVVIVFVVACLDDETHKMFVQFLVLHSALACLDIYPNIDRIGKVQCPVLIIHGRLDQEVDISHGQELYRAVPEQYRREPWWVHDRGHNDITEGTGKLAEFIRRLRRFISSFDQTTDDDSDEV